MTNKFATGLAPDPQRVMCIDKMENQADRNNKIGEEYAITRQKIKEIGDKALRKLSKLNDDFQDDIA